MSVTSPDVEEAPIVQQVVRCIDIYWVTLLKVLIDSAACMKSLIEI